MSHKKRNWSEYNKKLVNRGRITLWIDKDLAENPFDKQKGRGRPRFSDSFLIAALSLRSIYSLSLRSLQGFLEDFMGLLQVDCPVPHYSLYSKRIGSLELPKLSLKRPCHILVDASGVKVVGEGEWKVKIHGQGSRRKWVKIHIGVDESTQEIVALKTTKSNVSDSKMLEELLNDCPSTVKKVSADGAYDGFPSRKKLYDRGIEGIIPPPDNAVFRKEKEMLDRNDFLKVWKGLGADESAKKLTKKILGYHRRSLVETAFSRFKSIFGGRFRSRLFKNIQVEAHLKCWILNKI